MQDGHAVYGVFRLRGQIVVGGHLVGEVGRTAPFGPLPAVHDRGTVGRVLVGHVRVPEGRAFINADGLSVFENVGEVEYGRMVFVAQMIQEMRLLRAEFPGERVVAFEGHFLTR